MLIGSGVFVLLFLGGWNPLPWLSLAQFASLLHVAHLPLVVGVLSVAIFLAKVIAMIFFFMWVRWTIPRFRYDQVDETGLAEAAAARHRQPRRLRDRHRGDAEIAVNPPAPWPSSLSNANR
jgi:O-antigen ligase